MFKPQRRTASLGHLQAFLDDTRGQITLGEIPPIRRAALAAQGKKVRVALVGRDGEMKRRCCSTASAGSSCR